MAMMIIITSLTLSSASLQTREAAMTAIVQSR